MKLNLRLRGYTLLEILVVISIALIVFSVGMSGYRDFSRRQTVTTVVKQMISDLRSIQQYASIGQKPTGVTCDVLNGYSFYRVSSTNYLLRANCTNNVAGAVTHTIKDVTLADNLTFTSTYQTFTFKVLGLGTNLSASNVITITHLSGQSTTITVGVGGDVK